LHNDRCGMLSMELTLVCFEANMRAMIRTFSVPADRLRKNRDRGHTGNFAGPACWGDSKRV